MTDHEANTDEVKLFVQKLDAFAQGLSPTERALLATIVARAAAEDEDVEAHFFGLEPIIADPSLHLTHAYAMATWFDLQPHLHALLQHLTAGGHLGPHPV